MIELRFGFGAAGRVYSKLNPVWVATKGGRNVCISALHVDVTRRVHRGSERRSGQPWRRRLRSAARVVRGLLPAFGGDRAIMGRMEHTGCGAGGSAYRGAGRSLGR